MSEDDFYIGLKRKLMGQVNLVQIGKDYLIQGGSFTLSTGILADHPVEMTTSAAMVNSGIHNFVKTVSLELMHKHRINVVHRWPWLLIFLFVAIWGMTSTMTGCSPSSGDNGYHGISDRHPTGSSYISNDKLLIAFDMETITPDDRLYDFSPYQHHSHVMETTITPGLFGDARLFRTPADRIDLPETSALDIDGPLSIALWFRIDSPDLHQHIIAADDKFVVWVNQANRIRFTDTRGNGLETQTGIEAGQWYSLVAVFDGTIGTQLSEGNIRLYLDGEPMPSYLVGQPLQEPPTWKPGQLFPSDAAYIGFESHQGEPRHQELPFKGVIDEVLVFSRVLSLKEIMSHADREE